MINCSVDRTASVLERGFAVTRDICAAGAHREQLPREARVRREERQRERERIARELHDSLLQGLFGVNLQLQAAAAQAPPNSPGRPGLDHAIARMQGVIGETRRILLGLRSPAMESLSLEQALSSLTDEFSPGRGVQFRVFASGRPMPLRPALQEQIYLIGRESLINAVRHSEATSIEAEVEYRPQWLCVHVRDNGCGIDPETVRSGRQAHWGLAGMRERAAGIGAQLRIRTRLGAGTEVQLWIPGWKLAEAGRSQV